MSYTERYTRQTRSKSLTTTAMLSTSTYFLRHSRPGFIELPPAHMTRKADTAVSANGSQGKLKKNYPRCVALATTSRVVGECHASIPPCEILGVRCAGRQCPPSGGLEGGREYGRAERRRDWRGDLRGVLSGIARYSAFAIDRTGGF